MRYRLLVPVLVCVLALLGSCTPERKFQPGTDNPEWAFDKPIYQRPAKEPVPFTEGIDGLPDIYHSKQRVVFIKRPDRPDLRKTPRPAIFFTKDNGQSWEKVGNFGLGASYFALRVAQDGTYGICIIGAHRPDLAPANLRIQHTQVVDSTIPRVEVSLSPKVGPYRVNQQIKLTWKIIDAHLDGTPAKLYSKVVDGDKPTPWGLLKTGLPSSGTAKITVEQIPQRAQGVIYRIEATDKMGNIGAGYSKMLAVSSSAPARQVGKSSSTNYVRPKSQEQPKESAEPTNTSPDIIKPLSSRPKAPAEPKTTTTEPDTSRGPRPIIKPLSSRPKAPAEAAIVNPEPKIVQPLSGEPKAANQADPEMAELEGLLAKISNPVFHGKVRPAPEASATEPEPGVVIASSPLPEVEPAAEPSAKIVRIERVQKKPEKVIGGTASGGVVARPVEKHSEETVVKTSPLRKAPEAVVDKSARESAELLVPPLLAEPAVGPTEPIVTVRPPSAVEPIAKPEPMVKVVPAAEPVAPAPVIKPTPIVTAKPAPPRITVGPSHGQNRMAKPWERLGNPAASQHAPTMSNY